MITKVYIIAPNCFVIKGYTRAILIDLQRQSFKLLTVEQEKLIAKPLPEAQITKLQGEDKNFIDALLKEDILLLIPKDLVSLFPKMNNQFYSPTQINNFIIELNPINIKYADKIISSLNNLGCKFIEVRVLKDIDINELTIFLNKFSKTTVQCIDIFFKYKNINSYNELLKIKKNTFEVRWVYVYNTPEVYIKKMKNKVAAGTLLVKNNLVEKTNCGNISPFYFAINIPTYTESIHYNSCLNCKISIDEKGEIKNCPSMKNSFGNIKDVTLEDAVKNKNFSKLGNIKKDDIAVCKDCEFRHICTDCRAYTEDPNDIYSKPLKCGYDPYTGVWEEWSTNPLKQKAIDYYGMRDII